MLSLVLYFQGSNAKEDLLGDLFNLVEKLDTHIYILKIRILFIAFIYMYHLFPFTPPPPNVRFLGVQGSCESGVQGRVQSSCVTLGHSLHLSEPPGSSLSFREITAIPASLGW